VEALKRATADLRAERGRRQRLEEAVGAERRKRREAEASAAAAEQLLRRERLVRAQLEGEVELSFERIHETEAENRQLKGQVRAAPFLCCLDSGTEK